MDTLKRDILLIEACKKQEQAAYKEIYSLYSGWLYGLCLRYSSNEEDAQDALQEAFILIFQQIEQCKDAQSFRAWIKRITINSALAQHRKKNAKLYDYKNELTDDIQTLDTGMLSQFGAEEIEHYIQLLSPGRKQVFCAYFIEGYNHKEIAEMLKISEGTSKSQLHDAKKELRKAMENEYSIAKK